MEKQRVSFTICGRLSGLNDYTKACRTNRYAGAKMKNENETRVRIAIMRYLPDVVFLGKVHITYKWYEPNKKRDLDNVAFAKKFIQDALVDMNVLQSDDWRHIKGFNDEFFIDKENPRVEVVISEV